MRGSRGPLNFGVALIVVGLLVVFRAVSPIPAPDNPSPDDQPFKPAPYTGRIIAAAIGLGMIAAGAWFIHIST
jgi:hypothetical protein